MLRVLLLLMCCAWSAVPNSLADVASLEQSGEKVTGWLGPTESDTTPVSGTLKGDKLTLKTHPKPGYAVPFDTCELTVSADRMTGSIQPKGEAKSTIEFVRMRQEK